MSLSLYATHPGGTNAKAAFDSKRSSMGPIWVARSIPCDIFPQSQ